MMKCDPLKKRGKKRKILRFSAKKEEERKKESEPTMSTTTDIYFPPNPLKDLLIFLFYASAKKKRKHIFFRLNTGEWLSFFPRRKTSSLGWSKVFKRHFRKKEDWKVKDETKRGQIGLGLTSDVPAFVAFQSSTHFVTNDYDEKW
jgi:hypothetical protein